MVFEESHLRVTELRNATLDGTLMWLFYVSRQSARSLPPLPENITTP